MMNSSSNKWCMACLSADRELHAVNQEFQQNFCALLDLNAYKPASLCFECTAMLSRVMSFKQQVKVAYNYLCSYTLHNQEPKSLSKLSCRNVMVIETNSPHIDDPKNAVISYKNEELTFHFTNGHLKSEIDSSKKGLKRRDKSCINGQESYENDTTSWKIDKKICENDSYDTEPLAFVKVEVTDCDGLETDDNNTHELSIESPTNSKEHSFVDSDDEPLRAKTHKQTDKQTNKNVTESKKKRKCKEQRSGVVSDPRVLRKLDALGVPSGHVALVMLTWAEVEEERQRALSCASYTRHALRCEPCALGFNHTHKLAAHMHKHSPEAGGEACPVCSIRCKSRSALDAHTRRHRARWVCQSCGARYSQASVAADHCARVHSAPTPTHRCKLCPHEASSLGKLRMHVKSHAARPACALCGNTFRDRSSLRTHMFVHRGEKEHACSVCDKRFMFKKQKEIHETTHQPHQYLYCHQCDVSFKNQTSYYQHMKYNLKHIHPSDIKYACEVCGKRFVKAKRLEEHNLAVHLKLAPIQCTESGCNFRCASRAALRSHARLQHRGARAHRNHVCHRCGNTFKTKKSLESHLRSHSSVEKTTQAAVELPVS